MYLTYEPALGVGDEVVVVVEAVSHAPEQALVPVRLLRRHRVNFSLEPVQLLRDSLCTEGCACAREVVENFIREKKKSI